MKYQVVDKETGISIEFFSNKEDANSKAKQMTNYHGNQYCVKEVK